jgi:hypothetical protein
MEGAESPSHAVRGNRIGAIAGRMQNDLLDHSAYLTIRERAIVGLTATRSVLAAGDITMLFLSSYLLLQV